MKRLLLLTLLIMVCTGCTIRASAEMSILQKWDRPKGDVYKIESNTLQSNTTAPTK